MPVTPRVSERMEVVGRGVNVHKRQNGSLYNLYLIMNEETEALTLENGKQGRIGGNQEEGDRTKWVRAGGF